MTTLERAQAYAAAGLSVIPIRRDGSKAPACLSWREYQDRIPTPDELAQLFRNGSGIAAIAGRVSGNLEVLDFEAAAPFGEWLELIETHDAELAFRFVIVQTPSGGHHVFYRCETGVESNQKLAMKRNGSGRPEVLIETRAEGGYVLTVGSPPECHLAHKPYRLLQGELVPGTGEHSIPAVTAEQRELLLDAARSFNQVHRESKGQIRQQAVGAFDGQRPGDEFNQTKTWTEILIPAGWTAVGDVGKVTHWRRPGKKCGLSATTNYGDSDLLYVFSTNAAPFDHECSYSKFAAYALLKHGGDFSSAARTLAQDGYGSRPAISDIGEIDEEQTATAGRGTVPREYEAVTPAESFITRYVEYGRQRTDAPPEAHELMAVGLLSALAGPRPRLPLSTSVTGWPLCLWTLYVVNSTVGRKTSVINYPIDIAVEVLGREAVLFWEGSPQGIIQRLQQRDGLPAIFARDEYSGLLGQMNRGGHMAGLAQLFIRTYDGGTLENIRTRKKDKKTGEYEEDTDSVEQPYLVKLCASTWDSFTMRATIDNVLDGFLARFVVFTGASEPRQMQRSTPELAVLREELIEHARSFHAKAQLLGALDITDEVLSLAWSLEQEWMGRAGECSRPDAAGPALKRLSESVLKVAALLAIDQAVEGEIPCVAHQHFEAARQMGARWIKSTLALIDALGRTQFRQECDAVLSVIRAHPKGIKLSDLYRRRRNLKKRDFEEVLGALEAQEEIIRHQPEASGKKGRPPAVLYPATKGAA